MRKDTALSFRIPGDLKAELEKVALSEGRSLAQVCEALLAGGLEIYKKEGPNTSRRPLSLDRRRRDPRSKLIPAYLGQNPDQTVRTKIMRRRQL